MKSTNDRKIVKSTVGINTNKCESIMSEAEIQEDAIWLARQTKQTVTVEIEFLDRIVQDMNGDDMCQTKKYHIGFSLPTNMI